MFISTTRHSYFRLLVELILLALVIFALGSLLTRAQTKTAARPDPANVQIGVNAPTTDEPLLREYRGVRVGMTAEEARGKLGEPADKSDAQDFYAFSETESAQIFYDAARIRRRTR